MEINLPIQVDDQVKSVNSAGLLVSVSRSFRCDSILEICI